MTLLSIRLTPRASRNEVLHYEGGVLHLRLTAPPVEGAANLACCAFVADLLGVPKSTVSVKSGHRSREKTLAIESLTPEQVRRRLTPDAPGSGTSSVR